MYSRANGLAIHWLAHGSVIYGLGPMVYPLCSALWIGPKGLAGSGPIIGPPFIGLQVCGCIISPWLETLDLGELIA